MDLRGKKLAVTGAVGCIGRRAVALAGSRGLSVRGLDVSPCAPELARRTGTDIRVGSVLDPEAVRWLCRGADLLLHAAGVVREGADREEFRRLDLEGTRTVTAIARGEGVRRLVHVSSVAVYGFDYPDNVDEQAPLVTNACSYCWGKAAAEKLVRQAHQAGGLETTVLRAGSVYGPWSIPFVLRPIQEMRRGWFPLVNPAGTMTHLYVDNLVDAVWLAAEREIGGETFNITDDAKTTCRQYFSRLSRMTVPVRLIAVPRSVAKLTARFLQLTALWTGSRCVATPWTVEFLAGRRPYSVRKARDLLGYRPRIDLEEGMRRTEAWFRRHHGVPVTDRRVLSAR